MLFCLGSLARPVMDTPSRQAELELLINSCIMASDEEAVVFENLPNFRQAGGRGLTNKRGQRVKDGLLYRSSRTDFVTPKDKSLFLQLGIKSIIDLRRQSEYERSDGSKLLDDIYPVWILKCGDVRRMKPSLRWGGKTRSTSPPPSDNTAGRRYLVNMWTMKIIWHIFTQANFIVRWLSLILVLIDWLSGLHLFVKFYTWLVLNNYSVSKQYIDVVELAKPVIIDVIRFMCREDSLPMLIHCAHGKDRTGLLVAVVLGLLEVDNEYITRDYAESQVIIIIKAVPFYFRLHYVHACYTFQNLFIIHVSSSTNFLHTCSIMV